jgi:hypothetical protein
MTLRVSTLSLKTYLRLNGSPEKKKHTKFLEPWVNPDAHGRRRAGNGDPLAFSVKCVGVWDTVGAIGIPSDLPIPTDAIRYEHITRYHRAGLILSLILSDSLFGFNDRHLGSHIQRAYHAMALNELRKSFVSLHVRLLEERLLIISTKPGCMQV